MKDFFITRTTRGQVEIRYGRVIISVILALIILTAAFSSFKIIPTGYVGVKTTFGQVSSNAMTPGFNWKIPYVQSVSKVCTKQQDIKFEEQVWGETSERTAVFFQNTTVTYAINGGKATWIYSHVSDYKHNLVSSVIIASAIKSASKTQTPTNVTNRSIIEPLIQKELQKSLDNKYGEGVVTVYKVSVNEIDFEEAYQKAVADKQNAQIAYEKQQIANKQKVETAEADAQAKLKQAEADAEAKKIAANAQAEANKKLNDSLSDRVLQNKYYDTWDGKLPQVVGSNSTVLLPSESTK